MNHSSALFKKRLYSAVFLRINAHALIRIRLLDHIIFYNMFATFVVTFFIWFRRHLFEGRNSRLLVGGEGRFGWWVLPAAERKLNRTNSNVRML